MTFGAFQTCSTAAPVRYLGLLKNCLCQGLGLQELYLDVLPQCMGSWATLACMLTVWIIARIQLGQLWSPTGLAPCRFVRGQGLWGWCGIKVPQL